MKDAGALTARQEAFIGEYLANGLNATQAAIAAGYSAGSADTQGSRLLVNAKVAAVVAERTKARLAKREITAERVLDEIAKIAFATEAELLTTSVEMADKRKCLELLGKHLKLFTEKVEHSGNVGVTLLTSVPRPERAK